MERTIVETPTSKWEPDDLIDTKDHGRELAVLFGGRNKLTAEGPFLDLLMQFRDELFISNSLVVIGYSVRDPHVNHYILRWLNSDDKRRMYIIDAPGIKQEAHPFFVTHDDAFGDRVQLIAKGAKIGIAKLFT
jgi:hypothetical protein